MARKIGWAAMGCALLAAHVFAQTPAPDSTVVEGKIALAPGWRPRVYLVEPASFRQLLSPFEGRVVDSAEMAADGAFRFCWKNWPPRKGLFRLCIQPEKSRWENGIEPVWRENFVALALAPGSHISLRARADQVQRTYQLERGDAENQAIAQIRGFRRDVFSQAETALAFAREDKTGALIFEEDVPTLKAALPDADTLMRALLRARVAAENEERRLLKIFLDTTRMLAPGFVALQRLNPLAEYNRDVDFYADLGYRWGNLPAGDLQNWMDDFRARLQRWRPSVMAGDEMPDVAAPDARGDTVRLADLPGKLRLVCFWMASRPACRAFQKQALLSLYQEFGARGLEVLGYSFDADAAAWQEAVRADELPWPNVRDARARRSEVLFDLDLRDFPTVFAVDASGKVLARGLSAEELRPFAQRFFQQ